MQGKDRIEENAKSMQKNPTLFPPNGNRGSVLTFFFWKTNQGHITYIDFQKNTVNNMVEYFQNCFVFVSQSRVPLLKLKNHIPKAEKEQ